VIGLALLSAGSALLLLLLEAIFTMGIAIAVGREHFSSKGLTTTGTTPHGAVPIALACLGWGIDNNISQRLSIRDPMQTALLKSVGGPMQRQCLDG